MNEIVPGFKYNIITSINIDTQVYLDYIQFVQLCY